MALICFAIKQKRRGGFGMPDKIFIIVSLVVIILTIRIKNIGTGLRSINTLIHELSHAFMAIVTGGQVTEIKLNENASGSCTTKSNSGFKGFLVSFAGYTFSALFSYLLFFSIGKSWSYYFFYIFTAASALAIIFWIRNLYGIIWTLIFISLNLAIILIPFAMPKYTNHIIFVLGAIIAIDNFLATTSLLTRAFKEPKKAGDATNLAKATRIPAIFWALLFLAVSVFVGYKSYLIFLPYF